MAHSLDLHELNSKSAGIGSWILKVHAIRHIEYEYVWQGQPRKGEKLECHLVDANGVYCQGVVKSVYRNVSRGGGVDPAVELRAMHDKFKDGSVWTMTKVSLSNEKSEYIGSPIKLAIDLRKTKCTPVLQNIVHMAPAPAPEDD